MLWFRAGTGCLPVFFDFHLLDKEVGHALHLLRVVISPDKAHQDCHQGITNLQKWKTRMVIDVTRDAS